MAPRSYSLGKRASTSAETRQRILDATVELYRAGSIATTTLKAIAERADVSRGTILHHFGSADGLLGAVLDLVLESLELPDMQAVAAIERLDDRVRAFVDGMMEFQDRTNHWWTMFEAEMQRPELQQREAIYWQYLADLQAATLGPALRSNLAANAVLTAMVHPATVGTFFWAYEQVGLGRDEARPLLVELAVEAIRRVTHGKEARPA